jgi:hypothetical protein
MRAIFLAVLLALTAEAAAWAQAQQQPRPQAPPAPTIQLGAQQFDYMARTAQIVRRSGAVTASGITWNCAQRSCTVRGPWPAPGVGACRALALEVGAIIYYGHAAAQLNAERLAQCNAAPEASAPPARLPTPTLRAPPPSRAAPAPSNTNNASPSAAPVRGELRRNNEPAAPAPTEQTPPAPVASEATPASVAIMTTELVAVGGAQREAAAAPPTGAATITTSELFVIGGVQGAAPASSGRAPPVAFTTPELYVIGQ